MAGFNLFKWGRAKGEQLTINLLSLFPKIKPQTISTLKEKYNEHEKNLDAAISDLEASDQGNIADWLNVKGIITWLRPVIIIGLAVGIVYFGSKFLKVYKRK